MIINRAVKFNKKEQKRVYYREIQSPYYEWFRSLELSKRLIFELHIREGCQKALCRTFALIGTLYILIIFKEQTFFTGA